MDRDGVVVGSAARSVVRRENLLHAATAVLVRDSAGRIYVHRRSDEKDWAPGFHDCAAGGVLKYGEEPAASAARELAEELGVRGTALRPIGTSLFEDDTNRCFEHCFEVTWDGPVVHADHEVVWGSWMTLPELDALLGDPGWAFVPDTRLLLTRLAADQFADYDRLHALLSEHDDGQSDPTDPPEPG